jgi:hypothetical protein
MAIDITSSSIIYPTATGAGKSVIEGSSVGDGKYLREFYIRSLYNLGLLKSNYIIEGLTIVGTSLSIGKCQILGYYIDTTEPSGNLTLNTANTYYIYLEAILNLNNLVSGVQVEAYTDIPEDVTNKVCIGRYSYTGGVWTNNTAFREDIIKINAISDPKYTLNNPSTFNEVTAKAVKIQNSSETVTYTLRLNDSNELSIYNNSNTLIARIDESGNIISSGTLTATRTYNPYVNDIAEAYPKYDITEEFEEGDVISKVSGKFLYTKSSKPNDSLVIGVCSDRYGLLLGSSDKNITATHIPVSLVGEVPVKVIGVIKEGDILTTSNIKGVAARCDYYTPGISIGKAKENYNSNEVGKILVQIFNG